MAVLKYSARRWQIGKGAADRAGGRGVQIDLDRRRCRLVEEKLSDARVIVMDMNEQRLAFVRGQMGVPDTLLTTGDGSEVERLREMTDGQFCDVVIDATGSNKSMAKALEYCAFAGKLVYVGITQAELQFPHAPFLHRRELTILASRNALSRDFTRIVGLIEDGTIDTKPWITHRAAFEEMIGVFPDWLKPESRVIKAVVEMG